MPRIPIVRPKGRRLELEGKVPIDAVVLAAHRELRVVERVPLRHELGSPVLRKHPRPTGSVRDLCGLPRRRAARQRTTEALHVERSVRPLFDVTAGVPDASVALGKRRAGTFVVPVPCLSLGRRSLPPYATIRSAARTIRVCTKVRVSNPHSALRDIDTHIILSILPPDRLRLATWHKLALLIPGGLKDRTSPADRYSAPTVDDHGIASISNDFELTGHAMNTAGPITAGVLATGRSEPLIRPTKFILSQNFIVGRIASAHSHRRCPCKGSHSSAEPTDKTPKPNHSTSPTPRLRSPPRYQIGPGTARLRLSLSLTDRSTSSDPSGARKVSATPFARLSRNPVCIVSPLLSSSRSESECPLGEPLVAHAARPPHSKCPSLWPDASDSGWARKTR